VFGGGCITDVISGNRTTSVGFILVLKLSDEIDDES
jgi:hypothetical protein